MAASFGVSGPLDDAGCGGSDLKSGAGFAFFIIDGGSSSDESESESLESLSDSVFVLSESDSDESEELELVLGDGAGFSLLAAFKGGFTDEERFRFPRWLEVATLCVQLTNLRTSRCNAPCSSARFDPITIKSPSRRTSRGDTSKSSKPSRVRVN